MKTEQCQLSVLASEPDAQIIIDGVVAGQGKAEKTVDRNKEILILVQKEGFYSEERRVHPARSKNDLAEKNIVICLFATRPSSEGDAQTEASNKSKKHPPRNAPTCAILAFDIKSGAAADARYLLTDRFMVEFGQRGEYRIVDRARMADILNELKFSQSGQVLEGAVEAGNLLGVQYVIYGSVAKVGRMYTANVYMVSVETGAQVASATVDTNGELDALLTKGMAEIASKLVIGDRWSK
ncbi:MAG: DUF2380 domain-containing protein [bacterium]